MAGIAGRGTTYNLPNYHGELFALGRQDTPFLSAIGGLLEGIKTVNATEFEWQTYDLRAPDITRQRLEGADAPTAGERVRANVKNVVEIHHEAIDISYTKLAASAARAGLNVQQSGDPVINESAWQIEQEIKAIKRDVNAGFLRGVYQLPGDNTTPRKTRGLNSAITTNVTAITGGLKLTRTVVLDAMQQAWLSGGFREDETRTLITGAIGKRQLTDIFVTQANYQEQTRNVGGVNVQTIETDFGKVNIMLEPAQAADTITIASLDVVKPVALEDGQGKGVFFVEPLAKTGSSERSQLYGEFGLEYGAEIQHAKITGYGTA